MKTKCPICGGELWPDYYQGLWHCSHCPYCGDPNGGRTITTDNTRKEPNNK